MRTLYKSFMGAATLFILTACGGGGSNNPDDGVNTPPDDTCVTDCTTPPDNNTVGRVEHITVDRQDPRVMLNWTPAENAVKYGLTRINGAETDLGTVVDTSFEDTLPQDHMGMPVRYRVTPIGSGGELGPASEVMTEPPVEDPPEGNYFGEGDETQILNLLGLGGMLANWHGECNDGSIRDVQIQIAEEPYAIENGHVLMFYMRGMTMDNWGGYNFKTYRGQFLALWGGGSDENGGMTFLCNFSADPESKFFEGGGSDSTANLANPPCRFTPAPDSGGN